MATLLLSAAGAALGGMAGGAVLGVSSAVVGRVIGATLGTAIDQRLMGKGADVVEVGQVDRFRVMGSTEGAPLARVYGRMRVSGQIIWSSRFKERVRKSGGGGKGGPSQPEVETYSYSVSLAVALCEGEIVRIGRVWADGQQITLNGLNWRLYPGSETQEPDDLIEIIEGPGEVPAYRGTAYVVIQDLPLGGFGNRIPQLSFEVFRRPEAVEPGAPPLAALVEGVAMVPGTGEYALAAEPVDLTYGKGVRRVTNVNNDRGQPDLTVALEQLAGDLPRCKAVSLVVSWFGDDLRLDHCDLRPKVEQTAIDGSQMAWEVSGLSRSAAPTVGKLASRPRFGGTPADASVVQAIQRMRASGTAVMFYPFILMDVPEGNGLINPYTGAPEQPEVPWRGRITTSLAPGQAGSPDGTAAAAAEVATFMGSAGVGDFPAGDRSVGYTGPADWGYRRFILHYAHLCALAGGVDAFCIGSEMRGLTQVQSGPGVFPAVAALKELAADVRAILGPQTKIGYAADWSEYFGYRPANGSGDLWYHLDDLWGDPAIDFVGIDNYMPLSDWRDGESHADVGAGSIYDLDYLRGNVAGGEGYDWYYESPAARLAQKRLPIADTAYGEDYVFRYKDLLNWWKLEHRHRPGGVRAATPTAWQPQSKPIWFTELGCPAVDKGTNQPNVFSDPNSSENALPYFSSGAPDELIQIRYLQASYAHWQDPAANPISSVYGGPMVDMSRAFVWAWDARPWPDFPIRTNVWSDGPNHLRGHWLSGRSGSVPLADVVAEIAARAGVGPVDVSGLHGVVKGYVIDGTESARASLQPLMLAHGFDCTDEGGTLVFANRRAAVTLAVSPGRLVVEDGSTANLELTRVPAAEVADVVRVRYVQADRGYQTGTAEVQMPGPVAHHVAQSELRMALADHQAGAIAERWLSELQTARDEASFRLPVAALGVSPGDVLEIADGSGARYRVDRVDTSLGRAVEAVRVETAAETVPLTAESPPSSLPVPALSRGVYAEFMDLPLLTGSEIAHAPHFAVTADPWPGPVAIYAAAGDADAGYALNTTVRANSTMGALLETLAWARGGRWSRASVLVEVTTGTLESRSRVEVLNGANVAALRMEGSDWEVFQFQDARLEGDGRYRLSHLLRGQAGTEALIPGAWPVGTDFVLLDGAAEQIDLPSSALGLERHYRVVPAELPYTDPVAEHRVERFWGAGLRPYAPAHLRARRVMGEIAVSWVRRTRVDGDGWDAEVPLGEATERYELRVISGGTLRRTEVLSAPAYLYTAAAQAADGVAGPVRIEVAQISDRVGAGAFSGVDVDG